MRLTHHKEPLLTQARKYAAELGEEINTEIVIAHHTSDGILSAIRHQRAEAIVMGWKGFTNTRDRLFGVTVDRVIRQATCDVMLFKIASDFKWGSCLLPTSGGPNAQLAALSVGAVAREHNMKITLAHVHTQDISDEQLQQAEANVNKTRELIDPKVETKTDTIISRSVAGGIAKTGRDYDLVVIGAAKEPYFRKVLFGEIPEKVARFCPASVMVVKQYEGAVKSIFKRLFG
jgi:nucleotide-binding universal stress UspA family protein